MLLITGTLLFITSLSGEENTLVFSEGIQPLGENIFANHGADIHTQSIIINDSDGYTSTDPTKALGHLDEFREFYLRHYKLEDQTINVHQNYNITHISERAFEWASDVVVSEFHKVRSSFKRQCTLFWFLNSSWPVVEYYLCIYLKLLQCKFIETMDMLAISIGPLWND